MVTSQEFDKAIVSLNMGKPIILPTDTVYGVGVAVGLASTPQVIYDLKHRDPDKAIPWLVGRPTALKLYGANVPKYARICARSFWPGPLTLIVKAADNVPAAFKAKDGTIALRMPDDDLTLRLIKTVGFPLAMSSANIQGEPAPRLFENIVPEIKDNVAIAISDDSPKSGVSSTVLDCTGPEPVIIRQGAISMEDIQALL